MKKTILAVLVLMSIMNVSITSTHATNATISFTILPATGNNEIFAKEFVDAYNFAYEMGITTQKTIQNADIGGKLMRSHMAKMMSTYAIELMNKELNIGRTCIFDDIGDQTEEMKSYIKTACQLGIMGVGVTSFNPNGLVTRAEFGTVLSRILYGNIYNNGEFYYSNHLKILKEKGIIKDDNPSLEELRGYVMIMLMRIGG